MEPQLLKKEVRAGTGVKGAGRQDGKEEEGDSSLQGEDLDENLSQVVV